MIRFEVLVNKERLCVAGVHGMGVLSTVLFWIQRQSLQRVSELSLEDKEDLILEVAGLENIGLSELEHLKWLRRSLNPGDEVTIRILNGTDYDPPMVRQQDDPERDLEEKRRYYEMLKKEFEE